MTFERQDVFIHALALCDTREIGVGSRVWAFSHILPGAIVGKRCNICEQVFIENDVVVGDDVTIKSGVQLWDGVRVGDNVFIGPNATFTNDKYPRSKAYPEKFLRTTIEDGASIGANATILPGVTIGREAMVGAGAVVTSDVPAFTTVVGNPARIVGYKSASPVASIGVNVRPPFASLEKKTGARVLLGVGGCFIERLPSFEDMRGSLVPLERGRGLPFEPARIFFVYDVPDARIRGEHAHRVCEQFLVAISGALSIVVDDGVNRSQVRLNTPDVGLYIPPMIWGTQYMFEPETRLMVVASHVYDDDDYVREYNQFLALAAPL